MRTLGAGWILAIHLAAVAERHDCDDQHGILDGVDDAVITDANAEQGLGGLERGHPWRPRVDFKVVDGGAEALQHRAVLDLLERPHGGRRHHDGVAVSGHETLEAERRLELAPGRAAADLLQCGTGGFHVHAILEELEQF